jgi:hypothetical protein
LVCCCFIVVVKEEEDSVISELPSVQLDGVDGKNKGLYSQPKSQIHCSASSLYTPPRPISKLSTTPNRSSEQSAALTHEENCSPSSHQI